MQQIYFETILAASWPGALPLRSCDWVWFSVGS